MFEGSILIDHFEKGGVMRFVGVNRVYDGEKFSKAAAYNETVTGIIGLGPPKDESAKDRHFLHQLKENKVIE